MQFRHNEFDKHAGTDSQLQFHLNRCDGATLDKGTCCNSLAECCIPVYKSFVGGSAIQESDLEATYEQAFSSFDFDLSPRFGNTNILSKSRCYNPSWHALADLSRAGLELVPDENLILKNSMQSVAHLYIIVIKEPALVSSLMPTNLIDEIQVTISSDARDQIEKLGIDADVQRMFSLIKETYTALVNIKLEFYYDHEIPEWMKFRLSLTVSNDPLKVLDEERKLKKRLLQEFDKNIRELFTFSYNWG